jgi:hypothetical protein
MGACGNQKSASNQTIVSKRVQDNLHINRHHNDQPETKTSEPKYERKEMPLGNAFKKSNLPLTNGREIEVKIVLDISDNQLFSGKFNTNMTLLEVLSSVASKLPRNAEFYVVNMQNVDITREKQIRIGELFGQVDSYILTLKYLGLDIAKDMKKAYQKTNIIGAPKFETNPFEVIYYDKRTLQLKLHTLRSNDYVKYFGYFSSFCNGVDTLYISGGEREKKDSKGEKTGDMEAMGHFVAVDLNKATVKPLKSLIIPRYWHSMIFVPHKWIFIVGGANRKEVELYDIEKNTITQDSILFEERSEPSLCIVNNSHLYAFCGFKYKINYINTIECCNLQVKERIWEPVILKVSGIPLNINFFATAYYRDNILLLGGNEGNSSSKTGEEKNFVLNPMDNTLSLGTIGPISEVFQEKFFIPLTDNLSALIPIYSADTAKILLLKDGRIESLSYEAEFSSNTKTTFK